MAELPRITNESFAALLDSIEPPTAPKITFRRARLRERVCLLTAFDAADLPSRVRTKPHDPQVQQFLVEDCERVTTRAGQRWGLREDVRLDTLARLDRNGRLGQFPGITDEADAACQMALRYIRGDAPPLNRQTIDELLGCVAAVNWLSRTTVSAPALPQVRARIAIEGMLEPLRMLIADGFFGRARELAQLASYTDVPRAEDLSAQGGPQVHRFSSIYERPPLLVYGPGGVGKSTLMAKFVLDHVDAEDGARFPFAYLTFDRPELRLDQPLSLLADAAAQLGAFFPTVVDDASSLASAARSLVAANVAKASDRRSVQGPSGDLVARESADERVLVDRFASLVERAAGTSDLPNVWLIDTFEVAQRQAPTAIDRLWGFLDRLQAACPQLRVILCGRAPVSEHATVVLPLGELDAAAATEMLRWQLKDFKFPGAFLDRIVKAVSPQPVSLRIAVLYIRAAADGASSFDTAAKRRDLLLSLPAQEVEVVLYRRILDHIYDNDVRQIAHPGLALRRVTPEAIQHILAGPGGLGPVDRYRAQRLFDALSREVFLVEPDRSEGLRMRPDVRRVMLPMIERDNPAQLASLRRAALRYYSKLDTPQAEVEELYYRLVLAQSTSLLDRAFDDEAARLLDAPVEEYPPSSQVYLANRLGITVDPEISRQADDLSWGRQTALAARRLLDAGRAAEALELVTERRGDIVRPFTAALEIEALAVLRLYDEALAVASAAADWCGDHQDAATLTDVALLAARVSEDIGDFERARRWLREAARVAGSAGDRSGQLTARVALLRIHRRSGTSDSDEAQALRAEVIQTAGRLTTSDKSRNPGLVRDLAAEVGDELPDIARDALRFSGLRPESFDERGRWTSYEAADSLSEFVSGSPPALTQLQESLRQESDKGAF